VGASPLTYRDAAVRVRADQPMDEAAGIGPRRPRHGDRPEPRETALLVFAIARLGAISW
jgi:hypothetical protein